MDTDNHRRIFILISLLPHPNLFLSLEQKDSNRHTSSKPTQGAKKAGKNLSFPSSNNLIICTCIFGGGDHLRHTGYFIDIIFINMVSLRGRLRCKHYSALQKGRWKQVDLHTRHLEAEFIIC